MEIGNNLISIETITMTSNEILKADVLDIVFDNRNKMYGAYILRRYYGNRLGIALGLSVSLAFLLLLILKPSGAMESRKQYEGVVNVCTVVFPKHQLKVSEVKPPGTPPQKMVAQQRFTSRIAITKNPNIEPLATQEELLHARIGATTIDGDPELIQGRTLPPAPPVVPEKVVDPPAPEAPLQRQPEFPGGMQAWLNFLSNNLRTPGDMEAGEKRVVMIRFYVDTEGNVTGFTVVKSAGEVFDNEVIRVLKRMPRWKPAIQNNQPVAVSFTQPVTFMAAEE